MTQARAAEGPCWSFNPLVDLTWRDWGGDFVVHEAASGQTHLLDDLTAAVVTYFEDGGQSGQALVEQLDSTSATTSHTRSAIDVVVQRLELMGWLRRAN